MERKYQKTSGYWVYAHVTPDGLYYVGMSKLQPCERWIVSHYKGTILEPYINEYGWDNIQHKILVDGMTKEQAEQWEDRIIQALKINGLCINKQRSGGVERDDIQAYQKQYHKQWHEEHKEEQKVYKKQYQKDHKEELKQYNKQRLSTPEGKIYNRVKNYNRNHTPIESPMMAKLNYIMLGIVPCYIKNDDLK